MNRLQTYFLRLLAAAFIATGCQAPNDAVQSSDQTYGGKTGGGTTAANPAILYMGIDSKGHYSVYVMDSTGANQTKLIEGTSSITSFRTITWSPTGSQFSYYQAGLLKKASMTLSSSGVPTATNIATIYQPATSDSLYLTNQAWSATSTRNEIAFATRQTNASISNFARAAALKVISPSGGTITTLWTRDSVELQDMTWSPDDEYIAFKYYDFRDSTHNISIMDRDAGTVTSIYSEKVSSLTLDKQVKALQWSRSGANQIAYIRGVSNTHYVYLYDVSSGTHSQFAAGRFATWSPTNWRIVHTASDNNSFLSTPLATSTTSTLASSYNGFLDWKR